MEKNTLVERMRAGVAICNSTHGSKEQSLFMFVSLLHPKMKLEDRLELARIIEKNNPY